MTCPVWPGMHQRRFRREIGRSGCTRIEQRRRTPKPLREIYLWLTVLLRIWTFRVPCMVRSDGPEKEYRALDDADQSITQRGVNDEIQFS
jgi:hypothetical protein